MAEMADTKTGFGVPGTKAASSGILIAILAAGVSWHDTGHAGRRGLCGWCGVGGPIWRSALPGRRCGTRVVGFGA